MQLADACTLYKAEDKNNKSFQFLHCWNILRNEPKWNDKLNQLAANKSSNNKQKVDGIIDLTTNFNGENGTLVNNENACPEGDATKRPNGRKKAKQMLRPGGGDSFIETVDHLWEKKKEADKELSKPESFYQSLEIEKERLQIERARSATEQDQLQLKRILEEERIMTVDITAMDEQQKECYKSLRTDIIRRRGINLV